MLVCLCLLLLVAGLGAPVAVGFSVSAHLRNIGWGVHGRPIQAGVALGHRGAFVAAARTSAGLPSTHCASASFTRGCLLLSPPCAPLLPSLKALAKRGLPAQPDVPSLALWHHATRTHYSTHPNHTHPRPCPPIPRPSLPKVRIVPVPPASIESPALAPAPPPTRAVLCCAVQAS